MKKTIYILLAIYFAGCNIQESDKEKNITTVIENDSLSAINMDTIEKNIELVSFEYSECLENCDVHSKIYSSKLLNDSLEINLGVHLNCAGKFTGNIEIIGDTLNLKAEILPDKNGLVVKTDCNCFYKLKYILSSIDKIPSIIIVNGMTMEDNYKYESHIIELDSEMLIESE